MVDPSDNLRASDADRQRVAEQLKAALDEGRLALDEYDDRLQQVYTAKTYADLKVPLTPRFEVQVSFDISRSSRLSEYRDWLDNNRLPIEQTTSLREMNFSGNIRYSLTERGRELGRLVWVPRAVVPYVGAGAGALLYKLEQVGDFVDFVDLSVFPSVFESHAWAPSAQVFGGVDVRVLKRVYVTVDGRYLWAASDLGRDFIDFDPIDLAGFRLSGGVNFIF